MTGEYDKPQLVVVLAEAGRNTCDEIINIAEKIGFEVTRFQDSDDAIRYLAQKSNVRAVLTDIMISGTLNGIELSQAIRTRWPHIELAVTSQYVSPNRENLPAKCLFIPTRSNLDLIAATLRLWVPCNASPIEGVQKTDAGHTAGC